MNNGLVLSGTGNVSLGGGDLVVNDLTSGMSGGFLSATWNFVGRGGGTGTFTQSGGTCVLTDVGLAGSPGSSGTYLLAAGLLSCQGVNVGGSGPGNFTQSGGTTSVASLKVWDSGTYTLRGGVMSSNGNEYVGWVGNARFEQSGGTNLASVLTLGAISASSGTYNLSGGSLGAAWETIGDVGNGTFTQTGGTNSISGTLVVGNNASGTYNLDGGLLILSSLVQGSSSAFNIGGGTMMFAPTANGGLGNSDALKGLTVNAGASAINAAAGNTLSLGAFARSMGGAVDFNSGTTGTITTTRTNSNGILGPWATYGSGASMKYAAASGGSAHIPSRRTPPRRPLLRE